MTKNQDSENDASSAKGKLDLFERKVVFRTARGYFLVIAIFGILVFGGGMMMGASGLVRPYPDPPAEPSYPAPIETPSPMTAKEVKDFKARENEPQVEMDDSPAFFNDPSSATGDPSEEDTEEANPTEEAVKEFKALFPETHYSWTSQYETYCKKDSPYGCLRRGRRLVEEGIVNIFDEALTGPEQKDEDTFLRLLQDVNQALSQMTVEERGSHLIAAMEAHRLRYSDYQRESMERELELESLRMAHGRAVMDHEQEMARIEAEKDEDFEHGLLGVLCGLAVLCFVGVFLAHLAIERHLRELREIRRH